MMVLVALTATALLAIPGKNRRDSIDGMIIACPRRSVEWSSVRNGDLNNDVFPTTTWIDKVIVGAFHERTFAISGELIDWDGLSGVGGFLHVAVETKGE